MEDIHVNIFSLLPLKDIVNCMSVCTMYNDFCHSQRLWGNLFFREFEQLPNTVNVQNNIETFQIAINKKNNYYEKFKFCYSLDKIKYLMKNNTVTIEKIYNSTDLCLCNTKLTSIPQELGLLNNLQLVCISTDVNNNASLDEIHNPLIVQQLRDMARYKEHIYYTQFVQPTGPPGHNLKIFLNCKELEL